MKNYVMVIASRQTDAESLSARDTAATCFMNAIKKSSGLMKRMRDAGAHTHDFICIDIVIKIVAQLVQNVSLNHESVEIPLKRHNDDET